LRELFSRLVKRDDRRTEAEIQADVRQFILSAPFELQEDDLVVSLESAVGDRRRIDVEVGSTVIEVKRDLRREKPTRFTTCRSLALQPSSWERAREE
jgi:hypothetical protein